MFKKSQSRLFFLRNLYFEFSRTSLKRFRSDFYGQCPFYTVVCWGDSNTANDRNKIE